jgi:monoamine oxidase
MQTDHYIENIIIGAGIAGLNIAHQLKLAGKDFLLFQDTPNIDCRVKTDYSKYGNFEMGASDGKTYYHLDNFDLTQEEIIKKHNQINDILEKNATTDLTLHQLLLSKIEDSNDRELFICTTPGYYELKDRISRIYFDELKILDKYDTYTMSGGLSQLT